MAEFGRIDILVNNAGGWPPQPLLRTSERAFEQAFRFNVTSAFLMTRFTVPHMVELPAAARSSTSRRGRGAWCRPGSPRTARPRPRCRS